MRIHRFAVRSARVAPLQFPSCIARLNSRERLTRRPSWCWDHRYNQTGIPCLPHNLLNTSLQSVAEHFSELLLGVEAI